MYKNKQNSENGQKKQIPQNISSSLPPLPEKSNGAADASGAMPIRAVRESLPEQIAALPHTASTSSPVPVRGQEAHPLSYSHVNSVLLARRLHYRKMLRHLSRKRLRQERLSTQRRVSRFWLTLASIVLSGLFLFLSLSGGGAYIAYSFYRDTQEQFASQVISLRDLLPRDNLKMYDSKGVLIGQLTDQGLHTSVALQDISQHLINATVATEDKNFWTNPGVDVGRIVQSALDDLKHGRVVAGGSTITQQLIKTLIVGNKTNLERKLQEVALIPMVNEHYSKSDILEMYLNSIYYGEQAYGIDAAAYIYFGLEDQPGKPAAKQLSLAQSAMLAGIPQAPYAYDPLLHREAALARMQTVLDLMVSNGYIKTFDALEAMKEAQKSDFFKRPATLKNRAPHFFYFTLAQLQQTFHLSRQQLSRSDMSVTTTLNLALQDKIQKIMQEHIAALRDTHHVTNAAEVLIDFHTGAILSLLGSIDYNSTTIDGKYDVATQGYRQPGSSFKPYVYVTAFAQGASPAQAIVDAPLSIKVPGGNPPVFTPTNYDGQFHGHMTLRCALQNSLNIPAVKVLQHAGIDASMKTAREMGITSYNGT
ncbi:MAG: transglycosylase domain-containing protein, partial [Ktedonobacteraceae bacterium]|nr:transglycosylase domain-containing protein [Ktedonobacteraceae bacterium]